MQTKVFLEKFKGYPTFSVWEVDNSGQKVGSYPLFSLGTKKAIALSKHLEDFKTFAKEAEFEESRKNGNKGF